MNGFKNSWIQLLKNQPFDARTELFNNNKFSTFLTTNFDISISNSSFENFKFGFYIFKI